jgi:ribonuclease HI
MSEHFSNESIFIFTDAATSSKNIIAVGAFLCLTSQDMLSFAEYSVERLQSLLADRIIYKTYHSKKSTWSEIQTVIDSLIFSKNNFLFCKKIYIYTDCQSVCDLLGRRKEKLVKNNFISSSGKPLEHADLYKQLFNFADEFQITIVKIKGHAALAQRISVQEKIFLILDKLSRKNLRLVLLVGT